MTLNPFVMRGLRKVAAILPANIKDTAINAMRWHAVNFPRMTGWNRGRVMPFSKLHVIFGPNHFRMRGLNSRPPFRLADPERAFHVDDNFRRKDHYDLHRLITAAIPAHARLAFWRSMKSQQERAGRSLRRYRPLGSYAADLRATSKMVDPDIVAHELRHTLQYQTGRAHSEPMIRRYIQQAYRDGGSAKHRVIADLLESVLANKEQVPAHFLRELDANAAAYLTVRRKLGQAAADRLHSPRYLFTYLTPHTKTRRPHDWQAGLQAVRSGILTPMARKGGVDPRLLDPLKARLWRVRLGRRKLPRQ